MSHFMRPSSCGDVKPEVMLQTGSNDFPDIKPNVVLGTGNNHLMRVRPEVKFVKQEVIVRWWCQ